MKYNLGSLGWFKFERLVNTLLRAICGFELESYGGSKDKGREAIFYGKIESLTKNNSKISPGNWVFQAKYKSRTSETEKIETELINDIKREHAKLLRNKIPCDSYALLTNISLTGKQKDEIKNAAQPILGNINFVLHAYKDVEEHLDLNPNVVSAYPEIMNISQLAKIVFGDYASRNSSFLSSMQETVKTFATTSAYFRALDILNKNNFVILTGPPKMGKTVTAEALAAQYIKNGFEVHLAKESDEFFKSVCLADKYVVICDDIFGDISYKADKASDWSSQLTHLIRNLSPEKKMIWTSRSYIFKEALEKSKLQEEKNDIQEDKIEVDVSSLNKFERASITYNLFKTSRIPSELRKKIKKIAHLIIQNEKFSPESIRQFSNGKLIELNALSDLNEMALLFQINEFINAPLSSWDKIMKTLPNEEKTLLSILLHQNGSEDSEELRKKYESIFDGIESHLTFNEVIEKLTDTFIKKRSYANCTQISFYHPSIKDMIVSQSKKDIVIRKGMLESLTILDCFGLFVQQEKTTELSSLAERIGDNSSLHIVHLEGESEKTFVLNLIKKQLENISVSDATRISSIISSANDPSAQLLGLIETFIAAVSSRAFYLQNKTSGLSNWSRFFDNLLKVLTIPQIDVTPVYLKEFIHDWGGHSDNHHFWKCVSIFDRISPLTVSKNMDRRKVFEAKEISLDEVQRLINEKPSFKIRDQDDYESLKNWIDDTELALTEANSLFESFPNESDNMSILSDLDSALDSAKGNLREPDYDDNDYDRYRDVQMEIKMEEQQIIALFDDLDD
jgi:hypothetical protein